MAIPRTFNGLALATAPYSNGALNWGTGVNPIHAIATSGTGRDTAPDGSNLLTDPSLIEGTYGGAADFGYSYEDQGSSWSPAESWSEVGMQDRPAIGDDEGTRQYVPDNYPSYGYGPNGVTKGENIRAIEQGAIAQATPNQIPSETVNEGWLNKVTDGVIPPGAGISDPDQYTIQTSMQQLYKVRAGSQRGGGSASPYNQPIQQRIPGQVVKVYSTGRRTYDMFPKQQQTVFRPFWLRSAGTGHVGNMAPNAFYQSQPMSRVAPPDPYQGAPVGSDSASAYGYTSEDGVY